MSQLKYYNPNTQQWEPIVIGATGPTGPTGSSYVNIDGGSPTSVYGGITSLDGGELT